MATFAHRNALSLLLAGVLGWAAAPAVAWDEFLVLTSDYSTLGGVTVVERYSPWTAQLDVENVGSDAVARYHDGLFYVVGRGGANHIQILDPAAGYQTIRQFSLGAGMNPQDIAFDEQGDAYVSCYDTAVLLKVDVENGVVLDSFSTAAFADADGLPETGWMLAVDDLLYVTCQRLDRNNWYLPVGGSCLAVFDMIAEAWVDVNLGSPGLDGILLTGQNPWCKLELAPDRTRLRAGCNGWYGVADGGVEIVDLAAGVSLGYEVTESALGGDVLDFSTVNGSRAFVIVSDASFFTSVRSYDPSTGGDVTVVASASAYVHVDVVFDGESQLYLADRTLGNDGLRVFDAFTGVELTSAPVYVGLPPAYIALPVNESLVEVPPAPVAGLHLAPPWPNPCNPGSNIRFSGEPGVTQTLRIHDLRGRLVLRANVCTDADGGGRYFFDGNDSSGRPVASGSYLVTVGEGPQLRSRGLTVVR